MQKRRITFINAVARILYCIEHALYTEVTTDMRRTNAEFYSLYYLRIF